MRSINKITLMGRLGADPVRRNTKTGKAVVNFPLATSYRTQVEGQEVKKEETQWHNVVAWESLGEQCAQHLKKGLPALVEGTLRSHKYEGKDGIARMAFEVVAHQVHFLNFLGSSLNEKLAKAS